MKKRSYIIATILLSAVAFSLSSCLKDSRYVDFSKAGNIVDFPLGGTQFFGADAITEAPDTDANGTIVRQFAVNVATTDIPTTPTTLTLAVDNSIVATYNAAHPAVTYLTMPTNAFVFTATSVTIPAGKQYATVSVTFYKNLIDPSKSYMLPIRITATTGGRTISGNQNIHYYHFIGNDFAGAYLWDYTRTPAAGNFVGNPATLSPVNPTEVTAFSGYFTGLVQYDFTFTKSGSGASAVYTNLNVVLDPASVASQLTANSISVTAQPVFKSSGTASLAGPYTFAQVLGLLDFQYSVLGGSGARVVEDRFYKP